MVVDDMKQIGRSHLEGIGVQELPSKRRPRLLNRRFEKSCIAQFNGAAVVKYSAIRTRHPMLLPYRATSPNLDIQIFDLEKI